MKRIIRYKAPTEIAYYSAYDLAHKLNVSLSTIHLWIREGRIKAVNLGEKNGRPLYRIPPEEVERIVKL